MTVPVDASKYDRPSIVRPEVLAAHGLETGAYAAVPPPTAAIMCYHRGLAARLLETRAATTIPGFFGDTHLLDSTGGTVALVAEFGIGSPVAAVMLEDLVALGCRRIISIGTCGGMSQDLAVGELVVPDRAVRDEGTSHHYLPSGEPAVAHGELTSRLAAQLDRRGIDHRRSATWTTDAIYRETADEVRAHVAAGVDVVEMEAAALFAVGQVRGAEVASLLVVSDIIDTLDGSWVPEFHGELIGDRLELAFEVALAVLANADS